MRCTTTRFANWLGLSFITRFNPILALGDKAGWAKILGDTEISAITMSSAWNNPRKII